MKKQTINSNKTSTKLDWRGIAAILFFLVGLVIIIAVLLTQGSLGDDYAYESFVALGSIVTGVAVFAYERRWIEFFLMFLLQILALALIGGMSVMTPTFFVLFGLDFIFTIILCVTNKNRR